MSNLNNIPSELLNQIITGDARDLIEQIPDESIDLILCDPVYQELWQYAWLAEIAPRILKPYGSVLAQAGHIHRWQAEIEMQNETMIKRPLLTEIFTGGFTSIWMHRVLRGSIHYIWLEKTGIREDRLWLRTMFWGSKEKKYHRWGDGISGFVYMIDCLTKPGEVVLDPFTGGGTVPAACRMMGRHYIAFEIDPEQAKRSQLRLEQMELPLLIPEPQQIEMISENDE